MGRLVVSEFISIDGVIEDPGGAEGFDQGGWSFKSPAPESGPYKWEELQASDVLLLGRVTYEGFAAAWPGREEQIGEFAVRMNSMPKVVVSATLIDPSWKNTTVVASEVPAAVARLKDQYAGDILVAGSATLVQTLRQHNLVDEFRLMIHPVVLGHGKQLFPDGAVPGDLDLADVRKVGPSVVVLTYRPAGAG
jgi:dihydrofolate reductase